MTTFAKPWFGAAATLLTGVLFLVSLDLGPVGPLALLAPIPLLWFALSARTAWPVALAAAVARALGLINVIVTYDDIPWVALLMFLAVFALLFALVILLTRWVVRATAAPLAVFAYPVMLTSVEWLFMQVSPHGSFGSMGYSLVDVLPLLQVASLGGLSALTFCVALVPSALAVMAVRRAAWPKALLAGAIPIAAALAFGVVRLGQGYDSTQRVAMVGIDAFERRAFRSEADALATAQAYAEQVSGLASEHARFVVLPEKQFGGSRPAPESTRVLEAAAEQAGTTVVAGFDEQLEGGARVNSAQLLGGGQALRRYLKRKPIPGVEIGYTDGTGSFVDGRQGVAICKDLDFPALIRDYGRQDVQLMLVPAWDFVRDGRMHSRMALVRGVENGFAVARAAAAGRLTASDRYGRVIAEAVTSRDRPASIVADLGLKSGGTWYVKVGDLFAWLCLGAAALLLSWRWRFRARGVN